MVLWSATCIYHHCFFSCHKFRGNKTACEKADFDKLVILLYYNKICTFEPTLLPDFLPTICRLLENKHEKSRLS